MSREHVLSPSPLGAGIPRGTGAEEPFCFPQARVGSAGDPTHCTKLPSKWHLFLAPGAEVRSLLPTASWYRSDQGKQSTVRCWVE